ncbi:hypothetical protein N752_08135 [Desulforamulus aquiferis]|nr:CZB domain-containing protein [Desulforamulus aquiferis]RYD05853.1 hypothetical protein N752_08135 [Desulforamulus aquiferis]
MQSIDACLGNIRQSIHGHGFSCRLVDHANFLRKVMNEAGQGNRVASYTECNFGKWYEANRKEYSHIKAFTEVDEPHQRFILQQKSYPRAVHRKMPRPLLTHRWICWGSLSNYMKSLRTSSIIE